MESILLARLFLAVEGHDVGVLLTVVPVVDNFVAGDDHVRLTHGDVLGLNRNSLAVDGAAYSVAKHDVPLTSNIFILSDEDAVLIAARDLLQALHVLDVLLIDRDIPKDDAHVVALRLAEGKYQSLRKEAPHVVWLNVSEQYVRIDSKGDTQTVSFPSHGINHSSEGGHTQRAKMHAKSVVELDT